MGMNIANRDCETCKYRFIKSIGRACAWCESGVIEKNKKEDKV